ncbi:ribosome biogenesis protein BOP1-like [Passer montanus]|uniref:ribosome biogenesis protein BOP1-like n=1 Tax=Passer montanus TaxID=9160 RepID=UPI00196186F8|nr:ribosome biogenesis protein BOP1-like [Passer montanus]
MAAKVCGMAAKIRGIAAKIRGIAARDVGMIDIRNTVGNIPMEWYQDFPHIGYDLDGKRIYKPLRSKDELDLFLEKMENPEYWRTVQDRQTGAEVALSEEQLELVQRLQRGHFGDVNFDPYEPSVDFFSHEVRIHPVTNRPADKRSFIPSLVEKEKVGERKSPEFWREIRVGKLRRAGRSRWDENWKDPSGMRRLGRSQWDEEKGKAEENGKIQELAWRQQEPSERRLSFVPRRFPSLRAVPAYPRFIHERFERCLDLYLCPRQRRMRVNVDPEDLIPKLPRPRDLQPFPTTQALIYRGHSSLVRTLSVSPSGQWLASGSDDGTVRFWEVSTARCLRTLTLGAVVKSVAWNPNPGVCLLAVAVDEQVLLVNPGLGDRLLVAATDQLLDSWEAPEEERVQPVRWVPAGPEERAKGIRLLVQHGKVGAPLPGSRWDRHSRDLGGIGIPGIQVGSAFPGFGLVPIPIVIVIPWIQV